MKCPYCDSGTDADGDLLCGSSHFEDGVIQSAACQIDVLTAQRDALLAAARKWLEHAESNPGVFKSRKSDNWTPLVVQTRAAIAQCQPQGTP